MAAEYFAPKTRKNGPLDGTIMVVDRSRKNGIMVAALAVPKGKRTMVDALPVVTWTDPKYLSDYCVQVTEERAREVDPQMMTFVDKYARSPEYRLMHSLEESKPGRSSLQRANERGTWVGHKFYELYGA